MIDGDAFKAEPTSEARGPAYPNFGCCSRSILNSAVIDGGLFEELRRLASTQSWIK
jgi:hypothetical protein